MNGRGIVEKWESRDYLIYSAALILATLETLPIAGDFIRETQGSKILVFQVMSPGSEPDFRYSGPDRTTLRIHTKLVGEELVP